MPTERDIETAILQHLAGVSPGQDPTLCYNQLAARMGVSNNLRGTKRQLDSISARYGRPSADITWILKKVGTDYPSQIDGKDVRKRSSLTPTDKAKARAGLRRVIRRFCPGASNPY